MGSWCVIICPQFPFTYPIIEELGLIGSTFYVNYLNTTNQTALNDIIVNLNFDMIGSPNFFRGVYNGTSDPNSIGSAVVQNAFNQYYGSQNIYVEPTGTPFVLSIHRY